MLKLLNRGDIVRIPQGVTLSTHMSSERDQLMPDFLVLEKQGYGIFDQLVSYDIAQIVYNGDAWLVSMDDIFEGE